MALGGVLNDCSYNSTYNGGNTAVSGCDVAFVEEPATELEIEVSNGIVGRGLVHGGVNGWDSIATL